MPKPKREDIEYVDSLLGIKPKETEETVVPESIKRPPFEEFKSGMEAGAKGLYGGMEVATGSAVKEITGEASRERLWYAHETGQLDFDRIDEQLREIEPTLSKLEAERRNKYEELSKSQGNYPIMAGQYAGQLAARGVDISSEMKKWENVSGYTALAKRKRDMEYFKKLADEYGKEGAIKKLKEAVETKSWGDITKQKGKERIESAPQGKGFFYTAGTFIPQLSPTVVAMGLAPLTHGTSLAFLPSALGLATSVAFGVSGAGSFIAEYENYVGDKNIDPYLMWAGALASGAAETLSEYVHVDKAMMKIASKSLGLTVGSSKELADEYVKKYLKLQPNVFKKIAYTLTEFAKQGNEEGMEEVLSSLAQTAAGNMYKSEEDKAGLKDYVNNAWEAYKGGFAGGGVLGPVSMAGGTKVRSDIRKEYGYNLVEDDKGKVWEVIGKEDNRYIVRDESGREKKLSPDQVKAERHVTKEYADVLKEDKATEEVRNEVEDELNTVIHKEDNVMYSANLDDENGTEVFINSGNLKGEKNEPVVVMDSEGKKSITTLEHIRNIKSVSADELRQQLTVSKLAEREKQNAELSAREKAGALGVNPEEVPEIGEEKTLPDGTAIKVTSVDPDGITFDTIDPEGNTVNTQTLSFEEYASMQKEEAGQGPVTEQKPVAEEKPITEGKPVTEEKTEVKPETKQVRNLTDGKTSINITLDKNGEGVSNEVFDSRQDVEKVLNSLSRRYSKLEFEVIDQSGDDPYAPDAFIVKVKPKSKENAIQEQKTEGVPPHPQAGAGEGVGQEVRGEGGTQEENEAIEEHEEGRETPQQEHKEEVKPIEEMSDTEFLEAHQPGGIFNQAGKPITDISVWGDAAEFERRFGEALSPEAIERVMGKSKYEGLKVGDAVEITLKDKEREPVTGEIVSFGKYGTVVVTDDKTGGQAGFTDREIESIKPIERSRAEVKPEVIPEEKPKRIVNVKPKKRRPYAFLPKKAVQMLKREPQTMQEAIIQYVLTGNKFSRQDYIRYTGFKEGSKELNQAAFNGLINGKNEKEGVRFDVFLGELAFDFGYEGDMRLINEISDVLSLGTKANLSRRLMEMSEEYDPYNDAELAEFLADEEIPFRVSEEQKEELADEILKDPELTALFESYMDGDGNLNFDKLRSGIEEGKTFGLSKDNLEILKTILSDENAKREIADLSRTARGVEVESHGAVEGMEPEGHAQEAKEATSRTLEEEAKKYDNVEDFINAKFKERPKYGLSHRPSYEGMPPSYNLLEGDAIPKDVYEHPELSIASGWNFKKDKCVRESWDVLQRIRNNPEAEVTLYRAGIKKELNIGDWVTFSKEYAELSRDKGERVYSYKAKAKDVIFAGDDINEFGYYPKSKLIDIWNKAHGIEREEIKSTFRVSENYPSFYSNTEKALGSLSDNKRTPEQWRAELLKNGAKESELRFMGWYEFIKGKKSLTKGEVEDFVNLNKVEVKEVLRKEHEIFIIPSDVIKAFRNDEKIYLVNGSDLKLVTEEWEIKGFDDYISEENLTEDEIKNKKLNKARYGLYTTTGSKNYKEILLTLPSIKYNESNIPEGYSLVEEDGIYSIKKGDSLLENTIQSSDKQEVLDSMGNYISKHFPERNIAVHLRISDFKDRNGNKILLIEELQSDWSAEQRRKGNVPATPFPKTEQYVGLGMKWAVQYAAKNGYDGVAWTTGEQQNERYSLSQSVESIVYSSSEEGRFPGKLTVNPIEGEPLTYDISSEEELESYIGKDMTQRVKNGENEIRGEDLTFGGEGMKVFYDQIIPSWVNNYAKKFGVRTTSTEIDLTPSVEFGIDMDTGDLKEKRYQKVHYLPVNNSMVNGVMEGQPLFKSTESIIEEEESKKKFLEIKSAFNEIEELSHGSITAELVRTEEELPETLRKNGVGEKAIESIMRAVGKAHVNGFYHDGKAYIVSDNATSKEEAVRTLIHEKGIHGGIRFLIPDQAERERFLERLYFAVGKERFDEMVKSRGGNPEFYHKFPYWIQGEEYLAFLSEKIIRKEDLTPKERGIWEWLKNYIHSLIEKILHLDAKSIKFTDRELAHIVRATIHSQYGYDVTGVQRLPAEEAGREEGGAPGVLEGTGKSLYHSIQDAGSGRSRTLQHIKHSLRKEELNNLPYNHGTPFQFSQFDFGKIGEGRGEKIHGYGLYFNITTHDFNVGKSYGRMGTAYTPKGMEYIKGVGSELGKLSQSYLNKALLKNTGNEEKDSILRTLKDWLEKTTNEKNRDALSNLIDYVERKDFPDDRYLVTGTLKLKGREFNFLHWDDPIFKDEWDRIIARLKVEHFNENEFYEIIAGKTYVLNEEGDAEYKDPTGETVYKALSELLGGDVIASKFLLRAGFDGTMYFDKKEGERVNVCIFPSEEVCIEIEDRIMFRVAGEYEEGADVPTKLSKAEKFVEMTADRMFSVKKLQDEVLKRGGVIEDYSNVYEVENLASSKADHVMTVFRDKELKNISIAFAKIIETGKSRKEIVDYLKAKHTPERNEHFRSLGRKGERFAGKLTDDEARLLSEAFEREVGKELVDELWKSINDATNFNLKKTYEYGFIGKETYEELKSRWKYYVPLRGWEVKDELDSIWDYAESEVSFSGLHKAKGRESEADDPVAYIANMTYSTVISGEKNMIKQAAYRLANSNKQMEDLFILKKVYHVVVGQDADGNNIVQETYERPEQKLFDDGKVLTRTNRQYEKFRTKGEYRQNEVPLWMNGNKYVVVLDDPVVARAINYENMFLPEFTFTVQNTMGRFTRYLASVFTSKNPYFIPINMIRDVGYASMFQLVNKDGSATKFLKNLPRAKRAIYRHLKGKADPNSKDDSLYEKFLEYGGRTGWVHLESINETKKRIKKDVEGLGKAQGFGRRVLVDGIVNKTGKLLNDMATFSEDMSRFATFLTSVEQGKSYHKAAVDAKNITVNFNRKGRASGLLGSVYVFFNASVQGGVNIVNLARRNKERFAAAGALFYSLGLLNALLQDGLDDDDDEVRYFDNSPYIRQNYLCIKIDNSYLTLPLPFGFRAFYGIGEMTYSLMKGKITEGEMVREGLSSIFGNVSPVDPVGFIGKEGEVEPRPLVPTFYVPFYDIEVNSDFAGRRIYREPFTLKEEKYGAESQRYEKNTNPLLIDISNMLFKAGGGNTEVGLKEEWDTGERRKVGWIYDWNPSKAEHIITYYTGGVGKFFNDLVKLTDNVVTEGKEAIKENDGLGDIILDTYSGVNLNNLPVVNRLVRMPRRYEYNKEYNEIMKEFNSMSFAVSRYGKTDKETARELKNSEFYRTAERSKERLDRIYERIDRGNLTAEDYEKYEKEIIAIKEETVNKLRR